MLLYFVVLWIKKTFYSLPKLYYFNHETIGYNYKMPKVRKKTRKIMILNTVESCHTAHIIVH